MLKILAIAGGALLLLIILIIVLVNCGSKKELVPDTGFVYVTGGKAYYSTLESKSKEISLKDNNANNFVLSEDQKYIFYEVNNNLYRSSTKSASSDYVKVAADVDYYHISKNANIITYIKDDNLYQYNISKDSRTDAIAKDVDSFLTDDTGTKLIYEKVNNDDTSTLCYRKSASSDEIVLTEKVARYYATDDLTKVVYRTDDGRLYYQKIGRDAVKLTEKYSSISFNGDIDGTFNYFLFEETNNDNKKVLNLYKSGKTIEIATDANVILTVQDKIYYTKQVDSKTVLYYFNGSKSVELEASYDGTTRRAVGAMILIFKTGTGDDVKFKLAKGKDVYEINASSKAKTFSFSPDNKTLYFIDNFSNETSKGELKKASVGSGVKSPKLVVEGISNYQVDNEGDLLYLKDGDIYWNNKLMETEIGFGALDGKTDGKYFYEKDGDLYVSKGGRGKRIVSDVNACAIAPDGKVIVITNLNNTNGHCTLSYYTTKLIKIADDVERYQGVANDKGGDRYH